MPSQRLSGAALSPETPGNKTGQETPRILFTGLDYRNRKNAILFRSSPRSSEHQNQRQPMQFRYHLTDTLPPLAWCAQINKNSDTVVVFHGEMVETNPRGFVEGAWNDSFELLNFTEATVVCGSGGTLDDDNVRFSASTDLSCPLFSIVKDDSVFVSNSPVFIMTVAEEAPDALYPFYSYDLTAIWRQGLYCPNGELKLRPDVSLRVHFATTMSVDKEGSTQFKPHTLCDAPSDYSSYHAMLVKEMTRVFENAQDPGRKSGYKPWAGISSGYDSSATAALASLAGCEDAFTFTDSRQKDPRQDSGAANTPYLGMTCTEYDRWHYLKMGGRVDAEFAMFAVSATTPMAAMEDLLAGRMIITGSFGDIIWDTKSEFCHNLSRCWAKFAAGLGQIEFRLRAGYLSFAPAYIGARHNETIHRIINSEEMRDWSIGGKYDRPMPRRIAETAGLPRERFGMEKRASGHSHLTTPDNFSSQALNNYRHFVNQQHTDAPRRKYHYWRNRVRFLHLFWKLFGSGKRRSVPSSPWQRRYPFLLNAHPFLVPWKFMFTFQWAFDSLKGRYQLPDKFDIDPDGVKGRIGGSSVMQENAASPGKGEVSEHPPRS